MATSERTDRERLSPRRYLREIAWRHAIGMAAVAFTLFPIVWVVSAAVNPADTLTTSRLIPRVVSLDNFREVFTFTGTLPVARWIWNSVYIAAIASALNTVMSAMAAFSFSRLRWRGRRVGLLAILLVQMFPTFLAFVAIFLLVLQLGRIFPPLGLNSHAALIIVYLGGAIGFNTWLIKGFMDAIPFSLDESAKVDGASDWDIFARIILPLSRPVLAVIFIISFIGVYSEFILARMLLTQTDKFTFGVGLNLFIESDFSAQWGKIAAAGILGALPVLAVFLPAQRQIVAGLTQGAVKG